MRCEQRVGACTRTHALIALSHAWLQGRTAIFQPTTARPVAHRVVIPIMHCRLRGCAGSWSSASSAMRRPWHERRLTSHLHATLCRPEILGPCSHLRRPARFTKACLGPPALFCRLHAANAAGQPVLPPAHFSQQPISVSHLLTRKLQSFHQPMNVKCFSRSACDQRTACPPVHSFVHICRFPHHVCSVMVCISCLAASGLSHLRRGEDACTAASWQQQACHIHLGTCS